MPLNQPLYYYNAVQEDRQLEELTMGTRISARRREKGLTQEALANMLGVSNQAVSKWESDACCPDIALLPLLCDTLGMTLDELFGRESAQPETSAREANDQVLPVAAELPWADDDSIHAVLFQGHRLLQPKADSLFRHDKYDEVRRTVELHFSGTAKDVYSDFAIVCTDTTIEGGVKAGDSVHCGDVGGGVTAGDGVTCGSVGGSVQAGDSVTCSGRIEGNVRAGDGVECGDVGGDVSASDSVRCGSVGGNVRASDSVTCGDVSGSVSADRVRCASAGSEEQGNSFSFKKKGKSFSFTTR